MRRKDKEIVDPKLIEEVIEKAEVCHVAFCDGQNPYVVPMSYGYADGVFYLHCANEGRKIDLLRANSSVCVSCVIDVAVVKSTEPCHWGMRYRSVVAFGKASLVPDDESKFRALNAIMRHYAWEEYDRFDEPLDRISVIRVDVISITGKQSGQC